ncbi:MAG: STAS domain-containing protein [Desulfobacterales bacterium]|nr:STAS domain-containing protein [Desulfobacterales bacterium]
MNFLRIDDMKDAHFQVKSIGGKEGKAAEIKIGHEFSIHNVEDIKAELDKIADKYNEFNIKVDMPESFDLAALQLLVSFRKTAEKEGRKVKVQLSLPESLDQIINHSGIKEQLIY